MFYVDNYNSKTITDNPPVSTFSKLGNTKPLKGSLKTESEELLKNFWFSIGISIGENYEAYKNILSKYGYKVSSPSDVTGAITHIFATDKWNAFLNDIKPLIHGTVNKIAAKNNAVSQESGFDWSSVVGASASTVGSVAGVVQANKALEAEQVKAQGMAQNNMMQGLSALAMQNQQASQSARQAESNKTTLLVVALIAILLIIGIVVTVIVINKRKNG